MSASLALAGLTGCRWPKETIVPATRQPGDRVPGVPVQYATVIELGGVATGLLVTSYDGRPIKIEGNDRHPFSRGKSNAWMQASLLELYDPDRSQWPVRGAAGQRQTATWDEFETFARAHFADLRSKRGTGLTILSEASSSPSLADLRGRWQASFPQARWYEYEPLSRDNEREGARLAFGRPYRAHLHLDQADVIVSFDSDFLMTHPAALKYAGDFAARRGGDGGTINRLYVLESNLTVTGGMADHRWAVRSSEMGVVLAQLAARLTDGNAAQRATMAAIARDLEAHRGRCVVIVGPQQPPAVHARAHRLNAFLGAPGHTITFTEEPDRDRVPHWAAIARLADEMRRGTVQTLVILGGNPVYNAPADVRFASALQRVPTTIHLSLYDDETSQGCVWHVPRAHYLEAWGDARAWDGTMSIAQPLIDPLYGGRSPIELLALLSGDRLTSGYDIVRRTLGSDGPVRWEHALHDGVVADTAWSESPASVAAGRDAGWGTQTDTHETDDIELVFAPDYRIYDGRFANNAWLQELPDPITKLTWDNAALVSPADAAQLGVKGYGDEVRIETAAGVLEIPAYIVPGHADRAITLRLGAGRGAAAGKVADGAGRDAYRLRTTSAWHVVTGVKVTATGRHLALATTQDHHAIDSQIGREATRRRIGALVREMTPGQPGGSAGAGPSLASAESLWKQKEYRGHKWGMAIDLSTCIGCGACVIACQAENNIPVVGKAEVARGREMHWMRVDRYFRKATEGRSGETTHRIVHQPVTCVHCENAPCEQVCPVAATVHDEEGLNVQVYNRCVGTRYCANNCPFKVRRFNWFYNHHGPYHPRSRRGDTRPLPGWLKRQDLTDIEKLVNNPKVTVRSRGVMEKCTFCVQRINAVKIKARNERWPAIPDGLIMPACVQACPTDALVFGDLSDPASRVRKLHEDPRAYELLTELNLCARTKYLARLRNPAQDAATE
jgi:Fe-S-cluster-containing dehydrogenase component/anaerobic selenocysteine-containing dehydrogenase